MRDPKEFRERFQRWKNGENYWEQRGINMNTQQSQDQQADLLTPEQLTAIETALEYYTSGKDSVDYVPPEKNEPTVVGRKYISDIKKQNPVYYDIMKRVGQENYQDWGFPSAYEATAHALKDTDYDYKGYYDKYPESGANSQTHWNDEYKGVLHPTFSDESIYHNVQNDTYNPYGLRGGIWIGDRFIAQPYQNPFSYFNRGKDKGIHINPKNRGKFNALKKRTGKTTEQLTHSKNPLTRKRAIFAKMAKRGWKPLKKSK